MDQPIMKGTFYRMPAHFGPTPGPRQLPAPHTSDFRNNPKRRSAAVSYLTRADQLEKILPPGFALWGEPVITADVGYNTEIDWLAGRGYNTFGMRFPAVYRGKGEPVHGQFLTVLWENFADAIISGRDELGFSKIYCDIEEMKIYQGRHSIRCGWFGFPFFEMELWNLAPGTVAARDAKDRGLLHWKYVPRTGHPGEADAAYTTLTPIENPTVTIEQRLVGDGRFAFRQARWEDMPTTYHIVNFFAGLELLEFRGATLISSRGGKDISDQRIVE